MQIKDAWRRIAGIHCDAAGQIAAVWLAHDLQTDRVYLYDCARVRNEVLPVIAEGFNARGRWIGIVWEAKSKELAEELFERGCNMLPEPIRDSEAQADMAAREIQARMRSARFLRDKRLVDWGDEYKTYFHEEAKVPLNGCPLMTATRYAIMRLRDATAQAQTSYNAKAYPKVAII